MSRSRAVPALALLLALALAAACAGPPRLRDESRSGVWGYLRLVPHEGVSPTAPLAGAARSPYTDPRYAGARLVDYTRPGFSIVYLESASAPAPAPTAPLRVDIESGLAGPRFEPPLAATRAGATIRVENRSAAPHVLSCPTAGVLRRLRPGDALELVAERPGEWMLFLPGSPRTSARVFAAPGPFARVGEDGRYELLEVAPGPSMLHVWHPRFPPRTRAVALSPGRVTRVDVEMGVGLGTERADAE